MRWKELEALVASSVYKHIRSLSGSERKFFINSLSDSQKCILNSYNKHAGGEAYALWYHMMRTDNICVALDKLNHLYNLPNDLYVLDVGSGTGAGAMAIMYWIGQRFSALPSHVRYVCIEPAEPMRRTAKYLWPVFLNGFKANLDEPNALQVDYVHSKSVNNIEQCANSPRSLNFDFMLFCYTFSDEHEAEQDETAQQIVQISLRHLKPNGVMLFLTPLDPPWKIHLVNLVTSRLAALGMEHTCISNLPHNTRWATSDRQNEIIKARMEINKIWRQNLNMHYDIFDVSNDRKQPYYKFYGQIDILQFKPVQLL
jgi:SAM-dependent methyltransferase